jgi:hypothetical protein
MAVSLVLKTINFLEILNLRVKNIYQRKVISGRENGISVSLVLRFRIIGALLPHNDEILWRHA